MSTSPRTRKEAGVGKHKDLRLGWVQVEGTRNDGEGRKQTHVSCIVMSLDSHKPRVKGVAPLYS